MRILGWIWKAITYPFIFMYDPDAVIKREFEEEGPLDKDAHLSEYERTQKSEPELSVDEQNKK